MTGSEVGTEVLGETCGSSSGRWGQCTRLPSRRLGVGNSRWSDRMRVGKVWVKKVPKTTRERACPKVGHAKEENNNNEVCLRDGHQLDYIVTRKLPRLRGGGGTGRTKKGVSFKRSLNKAYKFVVREEKPGLIMHDITSSARGTWVMDVCSSVHGGGGWNLGDYS